MWAFPAPRDLDVITLLFMLLNLSLIVPGTKQAGYNCLTYINSLNPYICSLRKATALIPIIQMRKTRAHTFPCRACDWCTTSVSLDRPSLDAVDALPSPFQKVVSTSDPLMPASLRNRLFFCQTNRRVLSLVVASMSHTTQY